MAWYKTGTGTFTNGSPAVTGSGTAWVANAAAGQGIVGPDGRTYEVLSVNSDTSLTLSTNYQGSTTSGAAYLLVPTQDFMRTLAAQVAALINDYSTVKNNAGAGKFGDGTLSQPGIAFAADTDTGIRRYNANTGALVASGSDSMLWGPGQVWLCPSVSGAPASYPVVQFGVGQETAALADAGAKGGGLYLQGAALGAGSGGYLAFGTSFGNQTPFAAIKSYVINGSNNTLGYLSTSVRLADTATSLTEVTRVDNTRMLQVIGPNSNLRLKGGITGDTGLNAEVGSSAYGLALRPSSGEVHFEGGAAALMRWRTSGNQTFDIYRDVSATSLASSVGHLLHYVPTNQAHIFHVNNVQTAAITNVSVQPGADNSFSLGSGPLRWSVVYAGSGSINTSDARLKTSVMAMTEAEVAAARTLALEIGSFRFLSAVAEKGEAARRHIGMTVQRAIEIMESHDLEPMRYAFICFDEWEEREVPAVTRVIPAKSRTIPAVTRVVPASETAGPRLEIVEPERVEVIEAERVEEIEPARTVPAGSRYSFRTDQLALFIARGQAARQDALEARIAALEASA